MEINVLLSTALEDQENIFIFGDILEALNRLYIQLQIALKLLGQTIL